MRLASLVTWLACGRFGQSRKAVLSDEALPRPGLNDI